MGLDNLYEYMKTVLGLQAFWHWRGSWWGRGRGQGRGRGAYYQQQSYQQQGHQQQGHHKQQAPPPAQRMRRKKELWKTLKKMGLEPSTSWTDAQTLLAAVQAPVHQLTSTWYSQYMSSLRAQIAEVCGKSFISFY